MIVGLETSCDDTAVGVVSQGVVRANRVASQVPVHQRFGGVVPEVAARNHLLTVLPTLEAALADAGIAPSAVRGLAVTNRPGLIGPLLVGVHTAKALALVWQVPLVGVHHIEAHVWAAMLQAERPTLPFLALAVSGGHTSLYRVEGPGQMTCLGRTLDDAAGECFDKGARLLGLGYPGGPEVDRLAALGDPGRFSLPRGMLGRNDGAFSFSGLKTALRLLVERLVAEGAAIEGQLQADLCASFQATLVEQLVRVTGEVARAHGLPDVVLAGGVAANRGLRAAMHDFGHRHGLRVWPVPLGLCTDNGAMVAGLGEALLEAGLRDDPDTLDAVPTGALRQAARAAEV